MTVTLSGSSFKRSLAWLVCACCLLALCVPAQAQGGGADQNLLREAAELMRAGRLEEAEAAARKATAAAPRSAEARALLGLILEQRGSRAEAERELREAVRLDPRNANALTNLGVLLTH